MSDANTVLEREHPPISTENPDAFVQALLGRMTLDEKIGQMQQVDATCDVLSEDLRDAIKTGKIGAIINQVDADLCEEVQRLAVEESRLGIPMLIGRDVIHGFNTVFPIPLGQAASWNPTLVEACARASAEEASAAGVNWTFSPMIDISRDARWGRIAESFGEDPHLTGVLGKAMIDGYQGKDLSSPSSIAACAKHFVGYGASESGRDYDTTNIPLNELHNIYLPPFKTAVDAGVATFMTSFGDIDGIPATANAYLLKDILRDAWKFDGIVVSDWDSVRQLSVHGLTDGDANAAKEAITAGVDMEMAGDAYANHIASLVEDGAISLAQIDELVANILDLKVRLGLFANPYERTRAPSVRSQNERLNLAKQIASESLVLLENKNDALPLDAQNLSRIAIIGPMADERYEQLGTWIFDGDDRLSQTPLAAFKAAVPDAIELEYVRALDTTRSHDRTGFAAAKQAAKDADIAVLFLGEESILSGEAHSRAEIGLPGVQTALIQEIQATGTPVVTVILAGRPLTLSEVSEHSDSVLFAWHPGTMAGPAIYDVLFGNTEPSGRLPSTFPKMVGQIPIYYNHKNTGRPPTPDQVVHIDEIEVGAKQTSLGMTAFHLDAGFKPQYPFGFGLSYTTFSYSDLELDRTDMKPGETLNIRVKVTNAGDRTGIETAQLYIRDLAASVTRPIRELKAFKRVTLEPGQSETVAFSLDETDLSFFRRDKTFGPEPGSFQIWIGANSDASLTSHFVLTE